MLRLAGRGHRIVYAGCVGLKNSWRRGRAFPGKTADSNLQVVHLAAEPTARSFRAIRTALGTHCIRKHLRPQLPTVLWLYHPALLELGRAVCPGAPLVYDVMDRFPAFASSRPGVESEEIRLLREASVVFTGGRSLDRAIRSQLEQLRRPPSHCFPSGIDLDHFGRARALSTSVPDELRNLPRPVFGYFGAVDERIDFDLLNALGAAMPDASVVLIGPVLSPPPQEVAPNLHLLGSRSYDELPRYLKGFDVCLLPFRNTELVAHVSPTKTPEYLAGGRPVVSTPIPDVVADYGEVVRIAATTESFISSCRDSAAVPGDPEDLAAEARSRAMTWDEIAAAMDKLIISASS